MSIPTLKELQARYPTLSDPKLSKAATRRRQNQEDAFNADDYLKSAEENAPLLNEKLKEAISAD